ncbi:uncharacterized protein [Argopecten irradians]|uniref:uncharacterized protein n=1 Tax=Argopecten irradians TaxID=31199 RepID=UPI003716AA62
MDKNSTCSKSLIQMSKEKWNTFSVEAARVFYMFCTSGIYEKSLQYLSESSRPSDPDTFGVIGLRWFTRNYCRHRDNYPIYCHDEEGRETCGSLSKLQSVMQQGSDVRIFSNSNIALSLPILDEIYFKNGIISAGMLRYVASYQAVYNGTNIRKFRTDDRHSVFFYLSSHGTINTLRWYVDGIKKSSIDAKRNMDWYEDTCWSEIYSHNENGVVLGGSEHRLRASIMAGRRIRVVLDDYVAGEPDSVIVETDGHINTQLLSRVSRINETHFKKKPHWVWQMISTTGYRHILSLYLGSYDNAKDPENSTVSVQWYADTRPWRKLLTISESGAVTSGSKEVLSRSLKLCGMLRLVVTFSNSTVIAFTADNIEFFGLEVAAQFVRYIGHVQKPDSSDRTFAPEPHWNLILVTTEGRLTSSLWDVKDNRQISTNTLRVTSSWFVN